MWNAVSHPKMPNGVRKLVAAAILEICKKNADETTILRFQRHVLPHFCRRHDLSLLIIRCHVQRRIDDLVLTILETVWRTGWGAASPKIKLTSSKKNKPGLVDLKKNKSGLVRDDTKPFTVNNLQRDERRSIRLDELSERGNDSAENWHRPICVCTAIGYGFHRCWPIPWLGATV